MYSNDSRTVVTLDAGGTNFVFGAVRGNLEIVEPVRLASQADDLDKCMAALVEGFSQVLGLLEAAGEKPVAISFAFPGPADYPNGIIGGYLPNFPSFRDGVALGPFLEERFGLPVFINNDGDLYAYGEALAGALPEINEKLRAAGSAKQFHNLLGYTLGTGFGMGMVVEGRLNRGDNSCVETWCLPHRTKREVIVEDGVAIRAIHRVYGKRIGDSAHGLEPREIYEIAREERLGRGIAARTAFIEMGKVLGDAIATAVTLVDGLVVIGGGLAAAHEFFMPALLGEMRGRMRTLSGDTIDRMQMRVYNLDNEAEFAAFARGDSRELKVYGSDRTVTYDPQKRTGIMISKLGASRAISLGAYAFALSALDTHACV
ncbi:MAG: ROK family protein [Rikenellaceae bacterium]|nr:ROK family protein [Rikenellaceae bacterium]MCL2692207.1 ROK family protein [Rikenellaceae bacterium]